MSRRFGSRAARGFTSATDRGFGTRANRGFSTTSEGPAMGGFGFSWLDAADTSYYSLGFLAADDTSYSTAPTWLDASDTEYS